MSTVAPVEVAGFRPLPVRQPGDRGRPRGDARAARPVRRSAAGERPARRGLWSACTNAATLRRRTAWHWRKCAGAMAQPLLISCGELMALERRHL